MTLTNWWQQAVGYQIYPKSFYDSNNDGIGDLNGIRQKIPYLRKLGIDFVWLCPIYRSPGIDNGYDISDYRNIDPQYGTMEDFDNLIEAFHNYGIKVVMDMVLNHTSDQHNWFQQAKASASSPFHDYYIWKKGKNNGVPNNWKSIFGGSGWQYNSQTNEYYFHLYAAQQPDLNWENPKLRKEMHDVIKYWIQKGVDGFRLDAITHLKKLQTFEDVPDTDMATRNVPGIEVFLKDLKKLYDDCHIMTVGEVGAVPPEEAAKWVNPKNGFMDMLFQFDHVNFGDEHKFDFSTKSVSQIRKSLSHWQQAVEHEHGCLGLFVENHDLPRSISYFGNEEPDQREASAKAIALMYFLMKGIPFIYEGQELGMTNKHITSVSELNDVDSIRFYREELQKNINAQIALSKVAFKGRDNARTPVQWSNQQFGGFSVTEPWIEPNENYKGINVKDELTHHNSVFTFYQTMITIRKHNPTLQSGAFALEKKTADNVIAYRRVSNQETWLIVINLSNQPADYRIPSDLQKLTYEIMLSNDRIDINNNNFELDRWGATLIKFKNKE
ncbi:Oligo-1,6-glucosidase [Lentilactobacillus hilgardii]|uniref:glycoside hydrolase family 13 protein n=1 Tax=Lentilactobacillus hilgardii TaxID=1588 RepID=UPI00019C4D7F|nr:alpha-glucosidase [Lentilactobacillus hilgardii]EEI20263.1 alpha amylase, catalytic domain protein [Lentilactobacillus buchneri ATCC 11577]MCT3396876.1 alpha-glucosidase [Lentilactobacillus hilgardii]QIR08747.1 Oligo-1,6-glucosidase [Lentilactobacillus hilgardii]